MKNHIKAWLACSMACAALVPAPAASAEDAESALCQPPARTAAIIAVVPGFKSYDLDLYIAKRTITEGVVIRKAISTTAKSSSRRRGCTIRPGWAASAP